MHIYLSLLRYCNVYIKDCWLRILPSKAVNNKPLCVTLMDMEIQLTASKLFVSLVVVVLFRLLWHLYIMLVENPSKIRRSLKKQGIYGPKPKFLLGNLLDIKKMNNAVVKDSNSTEPPVLHNCGALLLPFLDTWKQQFGMFMLFYKHSCNFSQCYVGLGLSLG